MARTSGSGHFHHRVGFAPQQHAKIARLPASSRVGLRVRRGWVAEIRSSLEGTVAQCDRCGPGTFR
jgi:hypothetical protein